MYFIRKIKDFSLVSDEQFVSMLSLVYPKKSINMQIIDELERRGIRNESRILRYLLVLKKMKINTWTIERLLLTLFDASHPSNQKALPVYLNKQQNTRKNIKLANVIYSIKKRKLSKHFLRFVYTLEDIIFTLNFGDTDAKKQVIIMNVSFIFQLLELIELLKLKKQKSNIAILSCKMFHYKESWLLCIKNKLIVDQILFIILVNIRSIKDSKTQILENSLKKILFKPDETNYKLMYDAITDINEKRQGVKDDKCIYVPEVELEKNLEKFQFKIKNVSKTTCKNSLEWYNERTKMI